MGVLDVVYHLLIVVTVAASKDIVNHGCTTDNGESGICARIEDCSDLSFSAARKRLRRNSCGNKDMVCCAVPRGRRRSSVHTIIYRKESKDNREPGYNSESTYNKEPVHNNEQIYNGESKDKREPGYSSESKYNGIPKYNKGQDKSEHNRQCQAQSSHLPPDPNSGCCGKDGDTVSRILGGSITEPNQYPWTALIEYEYAQIDEDYTCAGFLISSRYVVTAKHCITSPSRTGAKPKRIILSEYNIETEKDCFDQGGGQECIAVTKIDIEEVIVHPNRDIAIMRLKEAAPYTDYIRPICLPTSDIAKSTEQISLTVVGWGLKSVNPRVPSVFKRQVDVPLRPANACAKLYRNTQKMRPEDGQICAGGVDGKDSCSGDSGGPLMYNNDGTLEAVGVVSFGPKRCGTADRPAVYTNVYEARGWINANIRA